MKGKQTMKIYAVYEADYGCFHGVFDDLDKALKVADNYCYIEVYNLDDYTHNERGEIKPEKIL